MIDPGATHHNDMKGQFDLSTQLESVCLTRILHDRNVHVYLEYMDQITSLTSLSWFFTLTYLNLYYLI